MCKLTVRTTRLGVAMERLRWADQTEPVALPLARAGIEDQADMSGEVAAGEVPRLGRFL